MTAKLILSLDGVLIQSYPLNRERMTIGRKADNDIVINNLAVSSTHAAIITILNDSFMEDLDSTNGMLVNGVPAKKHFLQNNDVMEIGKYKLKYLNSHVSQTSAGDFEKTMILHTPAAVIGSHAGKSGDTGYFQQAVAPEKATMPIANTVKSPDVPPVKTLRAEIQILNGPNAGKELELVKVLTTLGKPGVQVAVLTRRPQGYFITHVEGETLPLVNGEMLGAQPCQLKDHDLIELAGIKMEFYFKS